MLKIPLNIEENQKILLIIIGIVILVLVVIVLKTLIGKISQLQQEIKITQLEIKEDLKIQVRKDKILKEYDIYQPYLKDQGDDEQKIKSNFLKDLEKIAQNSDISIVSLSPSESSEEETYNIYYADFKGEGAIEDILNFLGKIQESKSLIKIDRLDVSSKGRDTEKLKLDAKISISIP
ncbi:MAG: hypothetical protein ISS45_04035 [Candidatus Omnitrophica bacterium]|nr:hypothetical protein [Candidatus Omnitrophota bacterium]